MINYTTNSLNTQLFKTRISANKGTLDIFQTQISGKAFDYQRTFDIKVNNCEHWRHQTQCCSLRTTTDNILNYNSKWSGTYWLIILGINNYIIQDALLNNSTYYYTRENGVVPLIVGKQ